jgi:ParB family transcriptional regulator, chromosome partitioning protein
VPPANPNDRKPARGLGRGLGALLGAQAPVEPEPPEAGAPPVDSRAEAAELRLDPAQIRPNPFQPRLHFDPVKLAELAESIREHGVLQPLIVRRREDGYQLVSGERRWRASQQAGLAEVPVVVKDLGDREMLEVALVENVQREDISPLEAAVAYKRLAEEFGLTQEEVAKRVGKSRPAVANTMRLLNLPAHMQNSLAEGKITEGHARALLGIGDPGMRETTWRSLLKQGGSVREAESAARRSRTASDAPPPARRDPHLEDVEARLRRALGTRVELTRGRDGKGTVAIEFYNDEDLNRILDVLGCG